MNKDTFQFNSPQYDYSLLACAGEDVFVSANSEIRRPQLVRLGSHIAIDSGFYLTTALDIGNYVHIGPYVAVIGGKEGSLKLGHFTNIAVGSRLVCVSDLFTGEGLITAPGIPKEFTSLKIAPIVIEDFVNIGAGATILPGVRLREGSVIGAGAVVTKDTEPWKIYVGNPARAVKDRPKAQMLAYAEKLGYPFP